jgi:hypothetical protein
VNTQRIKKLNLYNNPEVKNRFYEEIEPARQRTKCLNKKLLLEIHNLLKYKLKELLPFDAEKSINRLGDYIENEDIKVWPILTRYAGIISQVENETIKSLFKELISKLDNSMKEYLHIERKFENDFNCYIWGDNLIPRSPVNVFILKPFFVESEGLNNFTDLLPAESILTENKGINDYLQNDTLNLKINLTYDKTDILHIVDGLIIKAQKQMGKPHIKGKPQRARATEQLKLIENIFIEHYVINNLPENISLENTEKELFNYGLKITSDSIKRRYISAIKKKYKIKDIRELRIKISKEDR